MATSDQMKQDAHSFMMATVISASNSKSMSKLDLEAKEAYQARKETKKKKTEVTIPDDFFLALCAEVEKHIDTDKSQGSPDTMRSSPGKDKQGLTSGFATPSVG